MMTHTGGATVLSITALKKSLKIAIPCHTPPPLYCATLCFLSCTSVCKLCRTRKIVRTVLTPENETHLCSSLYGILHSVIPATEGSHSHTMTR